MCAKDRSHIAVRSQTDSIHSMREMLNIHLALLLFVIPGAK